MSFLVILVFINQQSKDLMHKKVKDHILSQIMFLNPSWEKHLFLQVNLEKVLEKCFLKDKYE